MKIEKTIKAFQKIEERIIQLSVFNLMEFNNEDIWNVVYELWNTGIREIIFNNKTYTIYYHPYVKGDTSTPRFEINRLSSGEILNLDNVLNVINK